MPNLMSIHRSLDWANVQSFDRIERSIKHLKRCYVTGKIGGCLVASCFFFELIPTRHKTEALLPRLHLSSAMTSRAMRMAAETADSREVLVAHALENIWSPVGSLIPRLSYSQRPASRV
jgi:hypothetical protein